MASIQRIADERAAVALADLLNGNQRRRPVVVVTIPADRAEPWIDVGEIAQEAGMLADVFLLPTGDFTWAFSDRMVGGTQVYGGAGRVYPVGHEWASDVAKSPLRFAFNAEDGRRATKQLISDMFRMAAAAGLLQSQPVPALRQVEGTVQMVVAGRALVEIGARLPAMIAEELTVPDVSIERLVRVGQHITGWYDAETNRIDVTKSLLPADVALAPYATGDVVLTKVTRVRDGKAELMLYPRTSSPAVTVAVLREDVTSNPLDDLRTLMTVGEVIPARVVATGPAWALVLNDVDDDEPIIEAPSLLAGGPPWLEEETQDFLSAAEVLLPAPAMPMTMATPEPAADEPGTDEAPSAPSPATPSRPVPSPATLDRSRPRPAPRPAITPAAGSGARASSTKSLLLKIDGLTAEVTRLKREQDSLRTHLRASADEREQLRYLLDQAGRTASRAEHDLKVARSRLRKAGKVKPGPADGQGPRFADREQGFRYLVLTCWATRTLPGEQADRPLPEYAIGPRFLDSLDKLEGIKQEKVADVVFEILTGLAPQIPSREVHRLRAGLGGEDPIRVREDGAVCWRASLQVKTPAARRIHYWIRPDGVVELSRVATHDDFDP